MHEFTRSSVVCMNWRSVCAIAKYLQYSCTNTAKFSLGSMNQMASTDWPCGFCAAKITLEAKEITHCSYICEWNAAAKNTAPKPKVEAWNMFWNDPTEAKQMTCRIFQLERLWEACWYWTKSGLCHVAASVTWSPIWIMWTRSPKENKTTLFRLLLVTLDVGHEWTVLPFRTWTQLLIFGFGLGLGGRLTLVLGDPQRKQTMDEWTHSDPLDKYLCWMCK